MLLFLSFLSILQLQLRASQYWRYLTCYIISTVLLIKITFLFWSTQAFILFSEVSVQNFARALVQVAHEIANMHNLHTPQP